MRISSSMYYKNLYSKNNSNLQSKLFDVNKQIASGLSIQYAKDDVRTFAETMRLDNEIEGLGQIKQSTESGYKMANQTDQILNEFTSTMDRMRVLMVNAANGIHSDGSLDAIADELRVVEQHFKNLSNTSINGQYLFSGTAVDVRPIAPDGTYRGNVGSMEAFTGSKTKQQYNISGDELFLGDKDLVRRRVTSNVINENLVQDFPGGQTEKVDNGTYLTPENSVRQLMGDTNAANANVKHHFYVRGATSNGTTFNKQIDMADTNTIQDLLDKVGEAYGNTNSVKVVDVSMNLNGQIVIEDKIQGSSKIEFHMVGATDYDEAGPDLADINDPVAYAATLGEIENLDGGEIDHQKFVDGTAGTTLFVKEFVQSDYTTTTGGNIDSLIYDRTYFEKNSTTIKNTIPQIIRDGNGFANASTKLSEVADVSQLPNVGSLDGTQLTLEGTNVLGVPINVQIDLSAAGSTFSLDAGVTNYEIFDMSNPRAAVPADDMTYQQLMDVINMATSNQLPATTNVDTDYDAAVEAANLVSTINMGYDGKIQYQQLNVSSTQTEISLYDSNSGNINNPSSVMAFNSNNAIEVRDPKTDFFKVIDTMITAVENHKLYPDGSEGDVRSVGIEDAIAMIDDLQDHVLRSHAKVGSQVNALNSSIERSGALQLSSMTLRSKIIDTDLAQASLEMSQLTINYQSMLSTVGKISQLNLVNYL